MSVITRSTTTPWLLNQAKLLLRKAVASSLALAGQHLREGQARPILDDDVQVFPTQPASDRPSGALAGAVSGDAVANLVYAAELLDVDVDQLARPLTLVADDGRPVCSGFITELLDALSEYWRGALATP